MQVRSRRHPVRIEPARVRLRFKVADVRRSLDVPQPILAQLEGIELDDATMAAVVASLGSGPRPVARDRARIERQIRELALEHAAGRLEDAIYLERLHELRDAKENLDRTSADDATSPERAVAWLRAL